MDVIEKLIIGGDQFLLDAGEEFRPGQRRENGQGGRIELPVEDLLAPATKILLLK